MDVSMWDRSAQISMAIPNCLGITPGGLPWLPAAPQYAYTAGIFPDAVRIFLSGRPRTFKKVHWASLFVLCISIACLPDQRLFGTYKNRDNWCL